MLIGVNRLRSASAIEWRTTGSFASGSDGTDSDYPTYRLHDGFAHNLRSRPSTSEDPWYLIINLGTELNFDSIAIIGHNLTNEPAVSVQIADNNAFTTNAVTVASWTPTLSSTARLVKYDLDHLGGGSSFLYSARYVRVSINPASAMVPEISEVILGQRRQLYFNPNDTYDPDSERTTGKSFTAKSGVKTFYIRSRRQKMLDTNHTLVNDIGSVRSLWQDDTEGGEHPFLWVPKPSSSPTNAYLMRFSDDDDGMSFGLPFNGPTARDWELEAEEIPLYRSNEV